MELSQLHQFILQTDIPVNCMWCELAVNFLDKNVLQDITSEDMLANNITSLCKQFLPNNQSMVRLLRPDETLLAWWHSDGHYFYNSIPLPRLMRHLVETLYKYCALSADCFSVLHLVLHNPCLSDIDMKPGTDSAQFRTVHLIYMLTNKLKSRHGFELVFLFSTYL